MGLNDIEYIGKMNLKISYALLKYRLIVKVYILWRKREDGN